MKCGGSSRHPVGSALAPSTRAKCSLNNVCKIVVQEHNCAVARRLTTMTQNDYRLIGPVFAPLARQKAKRVYVLQTIHNVCLSCSPDMGGQRVMDRTWCPCAMAFYGTIPPSVDACGWALPPLLSVRQSVNTLTVSAPHASPPRMKPQSATSIIDFEQRWKSALQHGSMR